MLTLLASRYAHANVESMGVPVSKAHHVMKHTMTNTTHNGARMIVAVISLLHITPDLIRHQEG